MVADLISGKPNFKGRFAAWVRSHQEALARTLVIVLCLGAVAIPYLIRIDKDTQEIHASRPEARGWDPDVIRIEPGQRVRLRLTSEDVVHGFGIGQVDIEPVDILPGQWTELTLSFDKPGVYTYYCTRWCGVNHWRMRGTLEVGRPTTKPGPDDEPLYLKLGLDLDTPHLSPVVPLTKPVAEIGDRLLVKQPFDEQRLSTNYYREHSPFQAYQDLEANDLTDAQRWAVVASIWKSNSSPAGLSEGNQLFDRNCSACHGPAGGGDGVFADDLVAQGSDEIPDQHGFKKPADLSDPAAMLGASPALIQGKILRGGMGTGMPMWGVIFTDDQIWNLVAYLYSFQFKY